MARSQSAHGSPTAANAPPKRWYSSTTHGPGGEHVTRPGSELKAYRKIALAPGQSEVVRFTIRAGDLSFVGTGNKPVVEPGTFDVWIAPSAEADGVTGSFELTV